MTKKAKMTKRKITHYDIVMINDVDKSLFIKRNSLPTLNHIFSLSSEQQTTIHNVLKIQVDSISISIPNR